MRDAKLEVHHLQLPLLAELNQSMKTHLTLLATLTVAAFCSAEETKRLLHNHPLPAVAAPSFKEPLDASWSIAKGKWTPKDGVLDVLDIPNEKHIPVLHHKTGLANAIIEVEFLSDGLGSFLVGCDSNKHVGRVVVAPSGLTRSGFQYRKGAPISLTSSSALFALKYAFNNSTWSSATTKAGDRQSFFISRK